MIEFIIGLAIAAIALPFIIGSLGGCLPAWFKTKIQPWLRENVGEWLEQDAPSTSTWLDTVGSWVWTAVVWLTSPVWFPLKMFGIGWVNYAGYIIDAIKGICPYTCEHGRPIVDHCPGCRLDELRGASTPDSQPHW